MNQQDRIEEVKKQVKEALWMAYCSGRAGNEYIPEEVLPDLLKRCQLFPQPLDDKELRGKLLLTEEEIEQAKKTDGVGFYVSGANQPDSQIGLIWGRRRCDDWAVAQAQLNKALALLQQYYHPSIEAQKLQIELAIRQERERIMGIAEKHYPRIRAFAEWQALKGGESEKEATNGRQD